MLIPLNPRRRPAAAATRLPADRKGENGDAAAGLMPGSPGVRATPVAATAGTWEREQNPPCPHCGRSTDRIERTGLDRLLSLIKPVARYRCQAFACGWQGLRSHPDPSPRRWPWPGPGHLRLAAARLRPTPKPASRR